MKSTLAGLSKAAGLLFILLLICAGNAYADFSGSNQPGQSTDYSFEVGVDVTSLSLVVTNTAQAYSHLLFKKGSAPTDQDYDFISQFDGRNNSINLELPELSTGTWYPRVRTPAGSTAHSFTVQMTTNVATMRSATYPVSKAQAFQSSGSLTSGQWHYYRVEIPSGSPDWRMVLNSSGAGVASLYVRKDNLPTTGSYLKSVTGSTNGTVILTAAEATTGSYYVGVDCDSMHHLGESALITW